MIATAALFLILTPSISAVHTPHVPTMENERTAAAEEEEKRREEGPTTPDLALPDTQFSSSLI